MKNLVLIPFIFSAYYVFADVCENGEKVKLGDNLFMKCRNSEWKVVEKRGGPQGPPCTDDPAMEANGTCTAERGHCNQYTEKGVEMDKDCPGTCESCNSCKCQDNSAWYRYCSYWQQYCTAPGVLGTWMTTNCRKTCGHCRCKCCSYNGKQHSLGARIPIPDKCGELVCEEGLVAGSSPLLPGAAQHPVSHPEELTLSFHSLHSGADCCLLSLNATGEDGGSVGNGTMVPEGWKGATNTGNGQMSLTCCHGSLQVPFEDAMMIQDTSSTYETSTTTATSSTPTPTTTSKLAVKGSKMLYSFGGQAFYKIPVAYGTSLKEGTVADTCEAAGLKAVCAGPSGCRYNSARCQVVEIEAKSGCGGGMYGASQQICGNSNPRKCPQLDGVFNYMNNWDGGSECGIVSGSFCVSGKNSVSSSGRPYFAYCVQTIPA